MHLLDHVGGVVEGDLGIVLLFVGRENLSLSKAGLKIFTPRSGFIIFCLGSKRQLATEKMTQRRNKNVKVTRCRKRDRQYCHSLKNRPLGYLEVVERQGEESEERRGGEREHKIWSGLVWCEKKTCRVGRLVQSSGAVHCSLVRVLGNYQPLVQAQASSSSIVFCLSLPLFASHFLLGSDLRRLKLRDYILAHLPA